MELEPTVILFDGVCKFCNASVNMLINLDKRKVFRFVALQSKVGVQYKSRYCIPDSVDSLVLVENGRAHTKSTAALHICRLLGGGWRLLYPLIYLPLCLRDPLYDLLARNRYRWFGKLDACMVPDEDLRSRFIDG